MSLNKSCLASSLIFLLCHFSMILSLNAVVGTPAPTATATAAPVNSNINFYGGYGEVGGYPGKAMAVAVTDIDGDGTHQSDEVLPTNGVKKLFYLTHKPVHRLLSIDINGITLPPRDSTTLLPNYSINIKRGWVTFATAFLSTKRVTVHYEWSSDLDVVVAQGSSFYRQNTYFVNNGNFSFTEQLDKLANNLDLSWTHDVSAGDMDGDGDTDLLMANSVSLTDPNPENWILRNDAGTFTKIKLDEPLQYLTTTESALFFDYDNDGDLDAFVGRGLYMGNHYRSEIFRNDNGVFNQAWGKDFPMVNALSVPWGVRTAEYADLDLDGDQDLIIGNTNNAILTYENKISTGPFFYVTDNGFSRFIKQDTAITDGYGFSMMASYREPTTGMIAPKGIAIDNQFIYVADSGNNRVIKIKKSNLTYLSEVSGLVDSLNLSNPTGIEVDDTYLYICDKGNRRVLVLNKNDLTWVATLIGVSTPFIGPNDLAVNNTTIYVVDGGNLFQFSKATFTENGGSLRSTYNDAPLVCAGGAITFGTLNSIDVDNFNLYLLSDGAPQIHIVPKNFDACAVSPFGTEGSAADQFQNPTGISVDETYIYIADKGNNRIDRRLKTNLNSAGGAAFGSMGNGIMNIPWGIAIDKSTTSTQEHYFAGPINNFINMPNNSILAEDMNNDGKLDIVSGGGAPGVLYTMIIQRNITISGLSFTQLWTSTLESNNYVGSIDVADLDGDGFKDIVEHRALLNSSVGNIIALKNSGNLSTMNFTSAWFSSSLPSAFNDLRATRIQLADVNGDGAMDAVFSTQNNMAAGTVYTNMAILRGDTALSKVIKITSESVKQGKRIRIIQYYSTGTDGKLKNLIGTEIK